MGWFQNESPSSPLSVAMGVTAGATQTDLIRQHLATWGSSERYRELEYLWALYWGTQYDQDGLQPGGDGLREWREDTEPNGDVVPTYGRKPLIRVGYGGTLVNRIHSLVFGPGQLPTLFVMNEKGERDKEATLQLERLQLQLSWNKLWRTAGLGGLVQGSCAPAFFVVKGQGGKRAGKFRLVRMPYLAHHVTPIFGSDDPETADEFDIADDDLVQLFVQRQYAKAESNGQRKWFLFRRLLTPTKTITYREEEMQEGGGATELPPLVEETVVQHDLGFVPAVWVRSSEIPGEVDGASLLSGVETLCEAIDRAQSLRHRGCEYHGDPRFAPKDIESGRLLSDNKELASGSTRIFPIPAELLEMGGGGQKAQAELIADLERQAQARTGIYIHDPSSVGGVLSALAIEQLFAPTVAVVRDRHEAYGEGMCLLAEKVFRATREFGVHSVPWPEGGYVACEWPQVVAPNEHDATEAVAAAVPAKAAGLICSETAARYVSLHFGVEDVAAEMERIAKERAEMAERVDFPGPAGGVDRSVPGADGIQTQANAHSGGTAPPEPSEEEAAASAGGAGGAEG